MVEFFGAHEFALLKPDALKPLSSLDKCPNKSVSDRGLPRCWPCVCCIANIFRFYDVFVLYLGSVPVYRRMMSSYDTSIIFDVYIYFEVL